MPSLEFEQKFVLDLRRIHEILEILRMRSYRTCWIRQYYNNTGDRYRATSDNLSTPRFVRENKRGISIGSPYSISLEQEHEISKDEFETGWNKYDQRRLQKTRYHLHGRHPDHKVIVDFFEARDVYGTYAIIAEDEIMLNSTTNNLYLCFELPIYLEPYILKTVDDADPAMKVFKSTNMVDVPENIEIVKRVINNLYENENSP